MTLLPPRYHKIPPDQWEGLQRAWEEWSAGEEEHFAALRASWDQQKSEQPPPEKLGVAPAWAASKGASDRLAAENAEARRVAVEEYRALPSSERTLEMEEAVYGGDQLARWVTFGFGDRPQINDFLAYVLATDSPAIGVAADRILAEMQKAQNERSEIQLTMTEIELLIAGVQSMPDELREDPAVAHLLEEARGALARADPNS